jgi:hypothetical protein
LNTLYLRSSVGTLEFFLYRALGWLVCSCYGCNFYCTLRVSWVRRWFLTSLPPGRWMVFVCPASKHPLHWDTYEYIWTPAKLWSVANMHAGPLLHRPAAPLPCLLSCSFIELRTQPKIKQKCNASFKLGTCTSWKNPLKFRKI